MFVQILTMKYAGKREAVYRYRVLFVLETVHFITRAIKGKWVLFDSHLSYKQVLKKNSHPHNHVSITTSIPMQWLSVPRYTCWRLPLSCQRLGGGGLESFYCLCCLGFPLSFFRSSKAWCWLGTFEAGLWMHLSSLEQHVVTQQGSSSAFCFTSFPSPFILVLPYTYYTHFLPIFPIRSAIEHFGHRYGQLVVNIFCLFSPIFRHLFTC